MATPAFRYQDALASEEIRLVKLIRSSTPDGPLRFCLQNYLLRDKPPFWTLSYAWGNASDTRIAYCDGCPFRITKSLYAALKQLIALDLLGPVWIDAISINQMDLDEKTHQVRMMQGIYRQSTRTIIWLGEGQSSDGQAMRLMQILKDIPSKTSSGQHEKPSCDDRKNFPTASQSLTNHPFHHGQIPPKDDEAWHALRGFFSRPWFSRIWIIQELCSSQNCVMLCGHTFMSCDVVLETALRWATDEDMPVVPLLPTGVVTARALAKIRCQSRNNRVMSLLDLLNLSKRFLHSVPYDRIFALLGLTRGIDRTVLDHRTPYREVLEIVVQQLHGQLLDQQCSPFLILHHCLPRDSRTQEFPSWLPEWQSNLALVNKITASLFSTSHYSGCREFHIENHQYLLVQGKVFDQVETVVKGIALMGLRDQFLEIDYLKAIAAEAFEANECTFVRAVEELRDRHRDSSAVENARYQDHLLRALCIGTMEIDPGQIVPNSPSGRFDSRDLWESFRDFVLNREIFNQYSKEEQWRIMRLLRTASPDLYYLFLNLFYEKRYQWLGIMRNVIMIVGLLDYWKGTTQTMVCLILIVQFVVIIYLIRQYAHIRWSRKSDTEVEYATAIMRQTRHDYLLFTKVFTPWWQEKSFFATRGGRFGWAVVGVEQDDRLCVFSGHRAPFVLRDLVKVDSLEHQNQQTQSLTTVYEQCGEAYVSDVMDYDIHKISHPKWQDIRLGWRATRLYLTGHSIDLELDYCLASVQSATRLQCLESLPPKTL